MTFGNTHEGTTKWELYTDGKMGSVFTIVNAETVAIIYAHIRNDPSWEASHPILRAVIYDWNTKALIASSEEVVMPASYDPENVYKWYAFVLPTPVTLPPGTYLLGLHLGAYGGIDWKIDLSSVINMFRAKDTYADGAGPTWGTTVEQLYYTASIFATAEAMQHGPVARFVFIPEVPVINSPVVFDGGSSEPGWTGTAPSPITAYEWDFGDGSPKAYGQIVNHTYTEAGDYAVSLTVTDGQGLTDTAQQTVTVAGAGPVSIEVGFEDEGDFEIGIENEPRHIIYSSPTAIIERAPKVWTYGGYSQVALRELLGGGLFDYLDFRPQPYNAEVPPPPAPSGTRCAKLELHNPDTTIDDETRRLEIFRYHDPYVREKTVEARIFIPMDFQFTEWQLLLRLTRELMFNQPGWEWDAWLNISIGITEEDYVRPGEYRISTQINHCSVSGCRVGRRYDQSSSPEDTIKFGEWFHLKGYLYRHEKLGKIKWWLNGKLVIDIAGTLEDPVCTMYIPPEVLSKITPYNPGGGQPYGFVASGINHYAGGEGKLTPSKFFVKDVTMAFYVGVPTEYTLTIEARVNGTTQPLPGAYTAPAHSVQYITAVPDEGYHLDHWELDGVDAGSVNPLPVLMNSDHTLVAFFSEVPPGTWSVSIGSAEGGTTTPAGTVTVEEGQSLLVQATPNIGYGFDYWEFDDQNIGSTNPTTITAQPVGTTHTLVAVFKSAPPIPPNLVPIVMSVAPGTVGLLLTCGHYLFDRRG